jgi:hypothetical protein
VPDLSEGMALAKRCNYEQQNASMLVAQLDDQLLPCSRALAVAGAGANGACTESDSELHTEHLGVTSTRSIRQVQVLAQSDGAPSGSQTVGVRALATQADWRWHSTEPGFSET